MLTKIPMSVAVKATAKAKAKKKSPTNKELFFPGKLYKLLLDPKSEGIICWMDHGRSWKIVDRKRIGGMLQKYFRHENVESFIRSVNGWGFKVCLAINIVMFCEFIQSELSCCVFTTED